MLDPVHAAVIRLPGARISTHLPWLEKVDIASVCVVEPTVMAAGAPAGLYWQASSESLPAATTTTTFATVARSIARNSACETPAPPRDIEMIERLEGWRCASATAHSMPAMTPEVEPEP